MTLSKIDSDQMGVEMDVNAFAFDDASEKLLKKMSSLNKENI